jgi:CRISPR-associated protein Csc2
MAGRLEGGKIMCKTTTQLDTLRATEGLFFENIPNRPQGHYVHFVLLRETESFPIFQTDGSLNTIRVRAGLQGAAPVSRLVMFKRKQSTPERLVGRELLRRHGIITDSGDNACEYNSDRFCKRCPDCIHYGYAIGEAGAEKSKVYVDSAFSISAYDQSHKSFRFNALNENGTMWDPGAERPRATYGEHDHIIPQVFFPALVTLRDPTYEGFLYVFGNLLRADRYGAGETRTGKLFNHVVALCFANGELFSNLRYTQAIYDWLEEKKLYTNPLNRDSALQAADEAYTILLANEPVTVETQVTKEALTYLVKEVTAFYQGEEKTAKLLKDLYGKTVQYTQAYGARRAKR